MKREDFVMSEFVNNSGQGKGSAVPEEIKAFNWGAFCLNWIWGVFNGSFITLVIFASVLLAFIPFIGWLAPLALCIWFGNKGNEWAWQNKKWESVEQFHKVQRTWATVGLILFTLGIICSVASTVLGIMFASSFAGV